MQYLSQVESDENQQSWRCLQCAKEQINYSFERKQSTNKDKKDLFNIICEEWSTLQAIAKFDFVYRIQ